MSQELEILQMVTTRLAESNIPYMVTGSIAMNYYAVPRMTRDIDIVAPEDLILSKLDWAKDSHSEIQLSDVRNLLAAVPQLDHDYLAGWAERLGLQELYREVMA